MYNFFLYGALIFFIRMKNSLPRRQHKKKVPKTITANECHLATIIFDIAKCRCLFLIHILPELIKTFCWTCIRICCYNLAIPQRKRRLIRKSSFAGLLFRTLGGRRVSIKHFEAKQLKERTCTLQCVVTSQDEDFKKKGRNVPSTELLFLLFPEPEISHQTV
ncbi:hypothetical protein SADUNF_Sadunf02G0033800 [Salix dunnii]|uniref:Uncharacterized protein n=1 Tax=Salix dunnii TaxID=1413687 RepID=A0A835N631_9ROSI|nr:hypothetical protein SADUNF_Sadunf02G0033800 [Salix dunnii]